MIAAMEFVGRLCIEDCRALERLIDVVPKVNELDDVTKLRRGEARTLVACRWGLVTVHGAAHAWDGMGSSTRLGSPNISKLILLRVLYTTVLDEALGEP